MRAGHWSRIALFLCVVTRNRVPDLTLATPRIPFSGSPIIVNGNKQRDAPREENRVYTRRPRRSRRRRCQNRENVASNVFEHRTTSRHSGQRNERNLHRNDKFIRSAARNPLINERGSRTFLAYGGISRAKIQAFPFVELTSTRAARDISRRGNFHARCCSFAFAARSHES